MTTTTTTKTLTSSRVLTRAFAEAGVDGFLAARLAGDETPAIRASIAAKLGSLDILVLGALADRVRVAEAKRGDAVRIHVDPPGRSDAMTLPRFDPVAGGQAFLRSVARARIEGAAGAALRVDVDDVGLQLAQVALAYGADELVYMHSRRGRGLAVLGAEGDELAAAVVRERELAALLSAIGRPPRFVEWHGDESHERGVDETSTAKRKFRAPGRETRALRDGGES